jgi:alanine-glyoxylate transaminase / serine-glyoxylate transaminase / serine-pyruvate transaminase
MTPAQPSAPFSVPQRILLGPGPSDVAPSVLRALAQPTMGHLDPELGKVQDELRGMLRAIFGTANPWTLALSGTGTSGMEASLVNLIEPGDEVLVAVHGYFGARLVEIARRCGARVTALEQEWGRASDPERLAKSAQGKRFKLLCAVHAETSTGVRQDLAPLGELARSCGALFLVDAVTSLGCMPVAADEHGIDAAYSCTQKGLSCPPGLSPVTYSERAVAAIKKIAPRTFYLDLALVAQYWTERTYHHTASSNLLVALHEAARGVLEEGLDARFARHRAQGAALAEGLEALGLELLVPPSERLVQLCAVRIPEGVDDLRVRQRLLAEFGIEIGGGLGPLKGRIWRIGLMGAGATQSNVVLCLAALGRVLRAEGYRGGELAPIPEPSQPGTGARKPASP